MRERQSTSSRETVVCGDKARRKVVYLSAGNEIEVELVRSTSTSGDDESDEASARPPAVFLLRYDSQYRLLPTSLVVQVEQSAGCACVFIRTVTFERSGL